MSSSTNVVLLFYLNIIELNLNKYVALFVQYKYDNVNLFEGIHKQNLFIVSMLLFVYGVV